MPIHSCLWSTGRWLNRLALLAGLSLAFNSLHAQGDARHTQLASASASPDETTLGPSKVTELASGQLFAVRVPLRVSTAVHLGSAELRITLSPDAMHNESQEDVVIVARLGLAQVSLSKGEQTLLLHGAVPVLPEDRRGPFHASDYSIHLGSGDVTNIGTPDDTLIDTKALADSLSALHLNLVNPSKH